MVLYRIISPGAYCGINGVHIPEYTNLSLLDRWVKLLTAAHLAGLAGCSSYMHELHVHQQPSHIKAYPPVPQIPRSSHLQKAFLQSH